MMIFDFDGTLVEKLPIDYDAMRNELGMFFKTTDSFCPLVDKVRSFSTSGFSIIDKYEVLALENHIIKHDVLEMYNNEDIKIIISRNGSKVIKQFFEMNHLSQPDFIACRDNCIHLKPHIDHLEPIFVYLGHRNVTIVGDSWHDKQLAHNAQCDYVFIK